MKRIVCLVTVVLAVLCFMPCSSSAAPTLKQIADYAKKMNNHMGDFNAIAENTSTGEVVIVLSLRDLARLWFIHVRLVHSILLINSLVQNPEDKERIKPIIDNNLKFIIGAIPLSIKEVNTGCAHVKSQAAIAQATKLRDDLRGLEELLRGFDQ